MSAQGNALGNLLKRKRWARRGRSRVW